MIIATYLLLKAERQAPVRQRPKVVFKMGINRMSIEAIVWGRDRDEYN